MLTKIFFNFGKKIPMIKMKTQIVNLPPDKKDEYLKHLSYNLKE